MNARFVACSLALAATFQSFTAEAQSRAERRSIKQLKEDIGYLASDELEGRRTGSEGERKAADYIEKVYKAAGMAPYNGKFRYSFKFSNGKEIANSSQIIVNSDKLRITEEGFPLTFSANKRAYAEVIPDVLERGNIWLMPMYTEKEEAADAHFEWEKSAFERTKEAIKQGATGVLFYDSYGSKYAPEYNKKSDYEALEIPVAFINYKAYQTHILDNHKRNTPNVAIDLNLSLKKTELEGNNVLAYVDNKAPHTVVLGAHYDHLGHGEDGNSLHAQKDGQIHNGADDNASGTAALLQLAAEIKQSKLRKYNYLFINFSGEEMGLIGSKAIVKDLGLDSSKIAYMINMDMVGRLNDSTHALTVGGVGTSPVWGKVIDKNNKNFKIAFDSSGVGPSDHSSFYYAGVPVLFFFTGTHSDYHKPSDDADKINYEGEAQIISYIYNIVTKLEQQPKPEFTATKQNSVGKVRFKVTLGIMPDYSFQDGGVRIDGVTDDRPAQKAGIEAGDIIIQMGDVKVNGMQSYMEALGKHAVGDTIDVTVMRGDKPVTVKVTF